MKLKLFHIYKYSITLFISQLSRTVHENISTLSLNSLYTFSNTLETSMQCETRLQSTIVARLRSRAKEIATEEREREREMQNVEAGVSRGGVIYACE